MNLKNVLFLVMTAIMLTSCSSVSQGSKEELPDHVDITELNNNLEYAMVCDMGNNPDLYMGKKVRADGIFTYMQTNDNTYFSVCVLDETKCCQAGLDFECKDFYSFPEDYPEIGSCIAVEGTFDTYKENGTVYCCLRNAEMKVIGE